MKVSILTFWAVKLIQKLFTGIGLHSEDPDASFDAHIAISINDMYHIIYGNMGVKRCVRTSGIKINVINQLSKKFNTSKFQNTDFQNFPLYFFKFLLHNVRPLCYGYVTARKELLLKKSSYFWQYNCIQTFTYWSLNFW